MQAADLVLIPLKGAGKDDLAGLRREMCERHIGDDTRVVGFNMPCRDSGPDYLTGVNQWHDAIAKAWFTEISEQFPDHIGKVALLVWGDPSLYDSTLRITEKLSERLPLIVNVIPGITAIQALCAAHAIPLNRIAAPVTITTGRQLREHGWPVGTDTAVVMLDGECSFLSLQNKELNIWWGAFLGMAEEILDHGPLTEAGLRIQAKRTAARAAHGWIMDIYLLRSS